MPCFHVKPSYIQLYSCSFRATSFMGPAAAAASSAPRHFGALQGQLVLSNASAAAAAASAAAAGIESQNINSKADSNKSCKAVTHMSP